MRTLRRWNNSRRAPEAAPERYLTYGAVAAIGAAVIAVPWSTTPLGLLARTTVGLVLVWAALAKAWRPEWFAASLRELSVPLLSTSSTARRRAAGLVLAAIELTLGAALVLGFGTALASSLAAFLLLLFTGVLISALLRGHRASCGCFGRAHRVSGSSVVRNLLLLALALVAATTPAPGLAAPGDAHRVFLSLAVLTLCAGAALLLITRRRRPMPAVEAIWPSGVEKSAASDADQGLVLSVADSVTATEGRPPDDAGPLPGGAEYGEIRALEHQACRFVAGLDSREAGEPDERAVLHLLELDLEINDRIERLYRALAEQDHSRADATMARLALLHWTIMVRRKLMRSMHTRVPGLVDDPRCEGDLVLQQLLLRYFDTLFEPRERHAAHAAGALGHIARQTACLGARQMAHLASALQRSFQEVAGLLRLNGKERVLPAMVQAASAPLLLIHDVEKHRGAGAPLARWFVEHHVALAEGVRTRRLPSLWHGLWLYDRRSGHLLGYRHSVRPVDEEEVDVGRLLDAIVRREALGDYDCSFAEMVERGPGPRGYTCAGKPCREARRTSRQATGSRGGLSGWLRRAGFAGEPLTGTTCGDEGGGGGEGGPGGGGGGCDDALGVAGRNRLAQAVHCMAERVMSPGEREMRCLSEGTGRCAGPLERVVKSLGWTSMPGVPLGKDCNVAQAGGGRGMGDVKAAEYLKDLEAKARQAQDAAQAAFDKLNKAEQERALWEERNRETQANEPGTPKAQFVEDRYQDAVNKEGKARQEFHQAVDAMQKADEAVQEERDRQAPHAPTDVDDEDEVVAQSDQAESRCPPDMEDCGDNNCTGMSEWARRTMQCMDQRTEPGDPWRTRGGRDPRVTDPSPLDDTGSVAWNPCLEFLAPDDGPNDADKRCWAVDCGPDVYVTGGPGGCNCRTEPMTGPGQGFAGHCDNVDCAEGVPVLDTGGCRCQSADVAMVPPGHQPFTIGLPPVFGGAPDVPGPPGPPFP